MNRPEDSWENIVSPDDIPVLQWFYKDLLSPLFTDIDKLFQTDKFRALYIDWNFQEWLSLYKQPFSVISGITEKISGHKLPNGNESISEIRALLINLLRQIKNIEPNDTALLEYIQPVLIQLHLQLIVGLNQIICFIKFGRPVQTIIENAEKDDFQAMINLIKLDKAFLEFEPVKRKIRYACLFHESWFLQKISNAMKVDFYKSKIRPTATDDLGIAIFWMLGFNEISLKEFNDFLWEIGIQRYSREDDLRKRLNKYDLKKFEKRRKIK